MNDFQPDILEFLAEIVQKNTHAYAADFDYDAKRLWDSAQETDMERRSFLWMSRMHGTWCVLEREAFLDDTNANCIWTHYADCPEGILAYRIVVEGIRDGKLAGKVIPIDYAKQVRRVMQSALPVAKIQYRDKDEYFCENSYHAFMNSTLPYEDGIHDIRYVPESEAELTRIMMLEIGWKSRISALDGQNLLPCSGNGISTACGADLASMSFVKRPLLGVNP